MISQYISRLRLHRSYFVLPQMYMSAQSKKDFEAIMTYNKLRKNPVVADSPLPRWELKLMKQYFDQILELRKRAELGFKPSKLFMVWRIATVVGRPIWEKEAIIKLGLADHKVKYAIVKNTASNNEFLWSIKHLIRVKPITFPDGFPSDEDLYKSFLKQNGELLIEQRLHVDCKDLEEDEELKMKTLDYATIKERLRLIWNSGYPKMH